MRQPVPLLPTLPRITESSGAATTPFTLRAGASTRTTRTDLRPSASWPPLFITFPQLDDIRFSHRWAGAIDANSRFLRALGPGGGRTNRLRQRGFTGLGVGAARFAADVPGHGRGISTERTELEMVRKKPVPFPPEPFASVGIQATRWSLNQADHNAGNRNVFLRTLDRLGLGLDS